MPSFDLRVNGSTQTVTVRDANEPLLYVLRNKLRLTGVKFGCGLAQCGTCTVLVDGAPPLRQSRRSATPCRRHRRAPAHRAVHAGTRARSDEPEELRKGT